MRKAKQNLVFGGKDRVISSPGINLFCYSHNYLPPSSNSVRQGKRSTRSAGQLETTTPPAQLGRTPLAPCASRRGRGTKVACDAGRGPSSSAYRAWVSVYARAEDGCEDVDRRHKSPLCVSHLPALDALAAHPDHSAVSASFPRLWGFLSRGPSGRRAAVPGGAGWKQKLWLLHLLFPEAGTH